METSKLYIKNQLITSIILLIFCFQSLACLASSNSKTIHLKEYKFTNDISMVSGEHKEDTKATKISSDYIFLSESESIQVTQSILDFIKENTDPYKKKHEATGSWMKSTLWIKDPYWIKKEVA
ncbi:hypothetical protein [Aquimarina sp. RZ0]|uniref:hypothetical protein n=1 Tax=Aquimarina sp. RZ0 TaxID=2607730 RepID=UPI0011F0F7A1|nr:hypothetical protein [Aquimarina sp. RZ0]KAA1247893.1 hypothetical protein F0000_01355 [Aquimarina sp. RZ0]